MKWYEFFPGLHRTYTINYTLYWADLMAAQGAFGTDFYDRSTRTIVGTMLWTEYRAVIKIGPKGALGSHKIRPIQSAPSLGQSIPILILTYPIPNKNGSATKQMVFEIQLKIN